MNQIALNKLQQLILGSERTLILSHQKPDGDALGSILALSQFFKTLKKEYTLFATGPISSSFSFLLKEEKIYTDPSTLTLENYDLIFILDSGDLKQTGMEKQLKNLSSAIPVVNIDHHQTNENFGTLNFVFPESSSTSEIIFNLFKIFNFTINKKTATFLLTGLITDTSNFSNPATTFSSLEIASHLLNLGAKINEISVNILKNKSLPTLKFWGEVLSRLTENKKLNMVTTIITADDLRSANLDEEALEGVTNFLNNLKGARVVLVLKAIEPGKIKGSFRTTTKEIDVSRLAKIFGGGGHQKAAGFTIEGNLIKMENSWRVE